MVLRFRNIWSELNPNPAKVSDGTAENNIILQEFVSRKILRGWKSGNKRLKMEKKHNAIRHGKTVYEQFYQLKVRSLLSRTTSIYSCQHETQ